MNAAGTRSALIGFAACLVAAGALLVGWSLARPAQPTLAPTTAVNWDPYGYFAVAPHQRPACGQRLVLTLHDEPGRELPDGLLVRVGDEHCWLSLVTHKRIVGMGAVDRWTYASADVPTEPVLGQAGIGPSVGREVQP